VKDVERGVTTNTEQRHAERRFSQHVQRHTLSGGYLSPHVQVLSAYLLHFDQPVPAYDVAGMPVNAGLAPMTAVRGLEAVDEVTHPERVDQLPDPLLPRSLRHYFASSSIKTFDFPYFLMKSWGSSA
jgi:hypothetical protein